MYLQSLLQPNTPSSPSRNLANFYSFTFYSSSCSISPFLSLFLSLSLFSLSSYMFISLSSLSLSLHPSLSLSFDFLQTNSFIARLLYLCTTPLSFPSSSLPLFRRTIGSGSLVDLTVLIDEKLSATAAHSIGERARWAIMDNLPQVRTCRLI